MPDTLNPAFASLSSSVIQDIKKDVSDIRAENNKIKDDLTGLKVSAAETSGQITHLAACFQELNATIDEFTKYQRDLNHTLLNSCNREERWCNRDTELTSVKQAVVALNDRIQAIERAKCPRSARFDEIEIQIDEVETRIDDIETVHTMEEGGNAATRPYKDYVLMIVFIATTNLVTAGTTFVLVRAGLQV